MKYDIVGVLPTDSIVKDWTKLRDWELKILVDRGYEQAIEEQNRREKQG